MDALLDRLRLMSLLLDVALPLLVAAAGWAVTAALAQRHAQRDGASKDASGSLAFWATVLGVAVGRGVTLATQGQLRLALFDLLQLTTGVSLYGFMAGVTVALWWQGRRHGIPFWRGAAWFALYAPLGIAVSRAGCLLTGFCGGRTGAPPLGVVLPGATVPRYPSDLYEAVLAIALFLALLALRERGWTHLVPLAFVAGYGLVRAAIAPTRMPVTGSWLAVDAIVASLLALAALLALVRLGHRLDKASVGEAP